MESSSSSNQNATLESTNSQNESGEGCGCNSSITISVNPTTGGQFDLAVTKSDTIENLKKLISKKLKVPKERICLLHRERQLRDGTVQENQLVNGSRLTLLPSVETGLLAQRPEQSVMQALESLNDSQVNDFLSGKAPLNLTMRLGDHMMLIQLQLSTVTPSSSSSSSSSSTSSTATSTSTSSTTTSTASTSGSPKASRASPSASPPKKAASSKDPLASLTSIVNKSLMEDRRTTTSPTSDVLRRFMTSSPSSPPKRFASDHTGAPVDSTVSQNATGGVPTSVPLLASSSPTSVQAPLSPTLTPANSPTLSPANTPTLSPANSPTLSPTNSPTFSPASSPTLSPASPSVPPPAQCKCETTTSPTASCSTATSTTQTETSGTSTASTSTANRPTLDTRALAEASRNLTQTLKQLSSEVLTSKSDPVEDMATLKRRQGAIIESMHHHGKGVYSGTFSGTLNPALQDRFGRPKRDISTIIHILNDLLCATPHYRNVRNATATATTTASAAAATAATATADSAAAGLASDPDVQRQTPVASSSAGGESLENQATRGKMERLRLIMEERREKRRAARVAPYQRAPLAHATRANGATQPAAAGSNAQLWPSEASKQSQADVTSSAVAAADAAMDTTAAQDAAQLQCPQPDPTATAPEPVVA